MQGKSYHILRLKMAVMAEGNMKRRLGLIRINFCTLNDLIFKKIRFNENHDVIK